MSTRYQVLPPTAPVPAPDDVLEQWSARGPARCSRTHLKQKSMTFLVAVAISAPRTNAAIAMVISRANHRRRHGRGRGQAATRQRRAVGSQSGRLPLRDRLALPASLTYPGTANGALVSGGVASGDFEPVFRALVGETAALSPSSILKLKADWQQEYEAWKKRPLRGHYVYLYADGLYLKAGAEQDKTALLVVLGVDEHGHKELLAMESGYRESTVAWARRCVHSRRAVSQWRRCWPSATARWGCGRRSTKCSPLPVISGVGITVIRNTGFERLSRSELTRD